MRVDSKSSNIANGTFFVYFALIFIWTLAWILKVNLDTQNEWLSGSEGGFIYWTIAKVFIWILPAFWLIRLSRGSLNKVYNFPNWKGWLTWGGMIGFLIALTGFIPKYLNSQPLLPFDLSYAFFSVLFIAPIFEELLIRGAILGNLQQRYSFWTANILSSVMFIGLHLPGWYFMDTLTENLTKPIGGALSIFLLGLAFGYATRRGKSVMGGTLAHFLNNLSSLR